MCSWDPTVHEGPGRGRAAAEGAVHIGPSGAGEGGPQPCLPHRVLPPGRGWRGTRRQPRATETWAVMGSHHFLFISPLVSWSPTCTPRGSGHGKGPSCPGPSHAPQGQAPQASGRPLPRGRCCRGLCSCSSPPLSCPRAPSTRGAGTVPTTWKQPVPRSSSSCHPLGISKGQRGSSLARVPVSCAVWHRHCLLASGLVRSGLSCGFFLVRCLR